MPANFPDSPTLNQTYTYGAMTWQWTGSYWSVVESANYTAVTAITANLVPSVNEVYNLGSATLRWRDLYLSGNSLVLGAATISASGSAITLPANSSIGTTSFGSTSLTTEDLTVTGNLTVNGTTTTINSTTLSIDDKNIVLADGAANAAAADGAGITVAGASATLTYASASDSWNVNKNILITPGTANGVMYLNASKVATTGSALTFDGSQLGVNGITMGRGAGAVSTNTALGASALAAGTTADYTTAIGHEAALSTTTATRVTAVGSQSLRVNTTGRNTAFGWASLYSNVTGTRNTALGDAAIYYGTGDDNTAVGYGAMLLTTTGVYNVAMGSSALRNGTTGSNSTAIGYQALYSNTTASNNTAVGYQAGYSNTTSIGLTAVGYRAGATKSTGFYITAIGGQALENATGDSNTAVGFYAMQATTTGLENVAVGVGAMQLNTTGSYNTAVGRSSLFNSTTASGSTAVGYQALYSNTSAGFNTALGYAAGYSNTTGNNNVFVGRLAGYTNSTGGYNVFIGYLAGYTSNKSTDGLGNTAIGTYAGYSLTTGDKNTFVGGNVSNGGAGYFITSGNANSILGNYNGNQGGLDIRTANNYIVLSDGDGNPRLAINGTEWLLASGGTSTTGDVISNGGGNTSGYNGILIGANMRAITTQANTGLPSWLVDIGGRAADGTTYQLTTADKFRVLRVAAGGSFYGTQAAFEVNSNGCVGLNTSAASTGTGITFPATQVASSDANTLDDYEEGSFTSTVTYSTTLTATPPTSTTTITGYYTKIGNVVTCTFPEIAKATFGGSSVIISNFTVPFPSSNNGTWATNTVGFYNMESQYGGSIVNTNVTYMVQVQPNSTTMNALAQATNLGGGAYWRLADASSSVRFSITYRTT